MSDFAEGIRKSVQAARESAKQQRDAQLQQEADAATRQKQNRQRASELSALIWERISAAADAGDGAIKLERSGGSPRTTFQVWWQESQPRRALQIVVDEAEGAIQLSWVVTPEYGQSVDAPSIEASGFDMVRLESVIELLIEQRRWGRGIIPMIPW